jgi:hypothetical protein
MKYVNELSELFEDDLKGRDNFEIITHFSRMIFPVKKAAEEIFSSSGPDINITGKSLGGINIYYILKHAFETPGFLEKYNHIKKLNCLFLDAHGLLLNRFIYPPYGKYRDIRIPPDWHQREINTTIWSAYQRNVPWYGAKVFYAQYTFKPEHHTNHIEFLQSDEVREMIRLFIDRAVLNHDT